MAAVHFFRMVCRRSVQTGRAVLMGLLPSNITQAQFLGPGARPIVSSAHPLGLRGIAGLALILRRLRQEW